ncbi:MAG: protein translocase SEC61 complex subunit gamma [Aigarchaeota archaeon]|nr:protein translocase SEC61 complex subunit gamma [Aigarchaeota archaeon]MDW8093006.1 protein translocase SEC61 complex subunit gamma [Nitrososphaerota archaeon]
MGLVDFFRSVVMLFRVASKPGREEYSIIMRVTLLGVVVIGALAFVIKYLLLAVQ